LPAAFMPGFGEIFMLKVMKKRILILVFSDLRSDARVRRQIAALDEDYEVTVVCFNSAPSSLHKLFIIQPTPLTLFRKAITSVFLLLRMYPVAWKLLHGYDEVVRKFKAEKFDLIIANDIEALPLAVKINPTTKILFDAHEYAPRHFEDKLMWRIFFQQFNIWMCRKFIPKTDGMITVGKGLAREYERNFGVKPVIVTNANNYFDIIPSPLSNGKIRLIHHGIATRSRRLELMIELMQLLDERFTLDLMLLVPGSASKSTRSYIDELKEKAKGNARIKFIAPVPSAEVVQTITNYDMGIFLLPPINFNYENTLPNKLFDFIQARLAIGIGPTPEMAEIVNTFGNGVVSEDFTAAGLAKKLNALTSDQIAWFKHQSGIAASEFNAEKNQVILKTLVADTISSK
jgi:glycosyltransferase involved in cell wall biosynthesis